MNRLPVLPRRARGLLAALVAAGVAALVMPASLGAQNVRGAVVRSFDQAPISGVVVLLLDDSLQIRARALTVGRGEFLLRAPAPGRYRLQTLRIGFRPFTSDPFAVARDTSVTLRLDQIPVNLPRVTAQEVANCRENPERSLATAILWDEARTAILAADITIRELAYRFDVMLHSRKYDMREPPELIESLFLREQHQGTQPWASFPADTLERRGYVTPTDSGLRYVAPDLDVLLSPYFLRTHCFRMRPAAAVPAGQVALEFWPVSSIRRSEIRGVLHFEERTRALRTVEFRYVNLPATVRDTVAGGEIEFAQLPNGAWILPRWLIRAPIPVKGQLADTVRRAGSAVNVWSYLPTDIPQTMRLRVTGGDLISVHAGDAPRGTAPLWQRPVATLEVTLFTRDSAGEQVVPGAAVGFVGSATQEVSDIEGRARFTGLVEGEYVLEASTPFYAALRVRPERLRVRFPGTSAAIRERLRLRTLPELVRQACGLDTRRAALVGSVIKDGAAVIRSPVLIEPVAGTPGADSLGTAETVTGVDGRYAVCGMPAGAEFSVTVRAPDGTVVRRNVRIEDGEPVTFLDVVFPGRDEER